MGEGPAMQPDARAAVLLWCKLIKSRGMVATHDHRTALVHSYHGLWVALCPECNQICQPRDDILRAACIDCGIVFAVVYPIDYAPAFEA